MFFHNYFPFLKKYKPFFMAGQMAENIEIRINTKTEGKEDVKNLGAQIEYSEPLCQDNVCSNLSFISV